MENIEVSIKFQMKLEKKMLSKMGGSLQQEKSQHIK